MVFDSLSDFLEMGRHGRYVWAVYGFSLVVFVMMTWSTLSSRRHAKNMVRKRYLRNKGS